MLNPKFISQVSTFSLGVNPEWSLSGTSGEMDNEAKGEGNSYTTEFRQYDSRIGRWLSLDPLMAQYPMMSPYVAFNNNPIYFVDPLGLKGEPVRKSVDLLLDDRSNSEKKKSFKFGTRLTLDMAEPIIARSSGFILGAVTNSPNAKVSNFVNYYKHHYKYGRNRSHRNMMIGAVGEGVAAEHFEGEMMTYEGVSHSSKSLLPDFKVGLVRWNSNQSRTNITGTWDFSLTLTPNHAGSYDLMTAGYDGISMNKKSFDLERGKDFTFLEEVKTISPYSRYAKKNIERGVNQAIKTSELNRNNNVVSILLMDEKTWTNAYEVNPSAMKSIHKRITSAGVVLVLVKNLNGEANCKLTEIWDGFKNAERATVEAGKVSQEKIGQ